MIKRQAMAVWTGGLKDGAGSFRSGTIKGDYSFASRFESGPGSTPEGLLGAAHAACFSMALSLFLEQHGHAPDAIRTSAAVYLDPEQLAISRIELETEGEVPGLEESEFAKLAEQARINCPVSKALAGVQIVLTSVTLATSAAGPV